jgi:hypothetical protein
MLEWMLANFVEVFIRVKGLLLIVVISYAASIILEFFLGHFSIFDINLFMRMRDYVTPQIFLCIAHLICHVRIHFRAI